MTPAFLEWRKKEVLKRIAEGNGHNTTEYQDKIKSKWREEDDERERVA